ncbi:hypothetical protein Cfor_03483, partial [Coptotermes formosanus]
IENFLPEADSHTIKLRWTKPTENGNCVLRYAIEWKALEDGSRNGSGVTENEFYVIGSLEACETYEVSVSAVNENHNTSEADVTNITTLADFPGKIENLLPEADSHTIKRRWTKPNENGNFVVHYGMEWKAIADGSRNGSGVTKNESNVIGSLEAYETYEVSLSAVNENNNTSEADITNVTTLAD